MASNTFNAIVNLGIFALLTAYFIMVGILIYDKHKLENSKLTATDWALVIMTIILWLGYFLSIGIGSLRDLFGGASITSVETFD